MGPEDVSDDSLKANSEILYETRSV